MVPLPLKHALLVCEVCASVLQVLESVSPDGLHPNSMGMGRLAKCIVPLVNQFASAGTVLATAGRH